MDKVKVGERLATFLKDNDLNTYSFAEIVHLSPATISRYLNGKMAPKITLIEMIASRWGYNPAWLLGNDAEKFLARPKNVQPVQTVNIPIIGEIACGTPALADENIMGYWPVPTMLLHGSKEQHFILQAKGDSMSGSRIYDGDYVLIRCQQTAENGQIVAALVNGDTEATLKRFKRINGMVLLEATNPDFETQAYQASDVRVQGIAVSNIIPRL